MKRSRTAIAVMALFGLASCTTVKSPEGSDYYTKVNIWYMDPRDIRTTNYHTGAMIPFGSKVTIKSLYTMGMKFTMDDKITFEMNFIRQHSTITMKEHFDRYFSAENPKSPGSEYDHFTEMEKENVKKGNVAIGMSKSAVLASYGYPPSHATPDLQTDYWRYWVIGRDQVHICFADGKVSKIEKLAIYGPPPGRKRFTPVSSLSE